MGYAIYPESRGQFGRSIKIPRNAEIIFILFHNKNCGARYPHATNIHQNTAPPSSSSLPQG
jgi:hypothetical protein